MGQPFWISGFQACWAPPHSPEMKALMEARYPNQTNEELLRLEQGLCPLKALGLENHCNGRTRPLPAQRDHRVILFMVIDPFLELNVHFTSVWHLGYFSSLCASLHLMREVLLEEVGTEVKGSERKPSV